MFRAKPTYICFQFLTNFVFVHVHVYMYVGNISVQYILALQPLFILSGHLPTYSKKPIVYLTIYATNNSIIGDCRLRSESKTSPMMFIITTIARMLCREYKHALYDNGLAPLYMQVLQYRLLTIIIVRNMKTTSLQC